MYSCSSGSCLLKPASTRKPLTALHASRTVTTAKTTMTSGRLPKTRFSRKEMTRDCLGVDMVVALVRQQFAWLDALDPWLPDDDHGAVAGAHRRGERLAVRALHEPVALSLVAQEHHAGGTHHHDVTVPQARAAEQRAVYRKAHLAPAGARVPRAEHIAAQAEYQQAVVVRREPVEKGPVVRRGKTVPAVPLVVGTKHDAGLGHQVEPIGGIQHNTVEVHVGDVVEPVVAAPGVTTIPRILIFVGTLGFDLLQRLFLPGAPAVTAAQ